MFACQAGLLQPCDHLLLLLLTEACYQARASTCCMQCSSAELPQHKCLNEV